MLRMVVRDGTAYNLRLNNLNKGLTETTARSVHPVIERISNNTSDCDIDLTIPVPSGVYTIGNGPLKPTQSLTTTVVPGNPTSIIKVSSKRRKRTASPVLTS